MDLKESIKSLFAPSNEELNEGLNKLTLDSFFGSSITKLKEKIESSNYADERVLLEKQMEDLLILNKRFKTYIERRMTRKTNLLLSNLFNSIVGEIEDGNSLEDEIEKIDKLINEEEKELNDNYDFFGYGMNFRDFVESKIDFIGTLETFGESDDINNFFHFFTIEYINFVNDNEALKLLHNNLKKKSGLIITEEELDALLLSTVKNLLKKGIFINNNIKFEIIIGTDLNQKKIQRSLSEISNCIIDSKIEGKDCTTNIEENIPIISVEKKKNNLLDMDSKPRREIRDLNYIFGQSRRIKNGDDNIFNKTDYKGKSSKKTNEYDRENYRNYLNNTIEARKNAILKAKELIKRGIITKEYLLENNYILYLELYPLNNDIQIVGLSLINYYLNNIYVRRSKQDGGNIKIDKKLIEKHKDAIISNLKILCLLFTEIESDNGNPDAGNLNGSSAKGLYQILTNDGAYSNEYFDKKKLLFKTKSGHKKGEKVWEKRVVRNTSSFETALNKIPSLIEGLRKGGQNNIGVINILERLFLKATGYNSVSRIKSKLPNNFSPTNLSSEEQTILFLVNSFENGKIVNNNEIKDYMGLVILGNIWGTEKIYEIFHHTSPDSNTLELIKRSVALHQKKFINIK